MAGQGRKRVCYTAVANWYLSGLSVKHQQTTNRKLIFLEIITVFYSKSKWKWGFILCTGLDLLAFKWISENLSYTSAVPNLCGTKDQFHGRPFFHGWVGNGLGMIQAHCIYCALYFYYHCISSMSNHQHQIHPIDCAKHHEVPDLGIMVWHISFLLLLSCSVVSDPMDCSLPDSSLSMGLSWQEYWTGLPLSPPGELPIPGIEPVSPALAGGFFTTKLPGKSQHLYPYTI